MKKTNCIRLRLANDRDVKFLWHLRNQKEVRRQSFDGRFISFAEHFEWFAKKRKEAGAEMYIIMKHQKKVGQIRLERMRRGTSLVNIALRRSYIGRGIGSNALRFLIKKASGLKIRRCFSAYVKSQNCASQRCFEKVGFKKRKSVYLFGSLCHEYKINL